MYIRTHTTKDTHKQKNATCEVIAKIERFQKIIFIKTTESHKKACTMGATVKSGPTTTTL